MKWWPWRHNRSLIPCYVCHVAYVKKRCLSCIVPAILWTFLTNPPPLLMPMSYTLTRSTWFSLKFLFSSLNIGFLKILLKSLFHILTTCHWYSLWNNMNENYLFSLSFSQAVFWIFRFTFAGMADTLPGKVRYEHYVMWHVASLAVFEVGWGECWAELRRFGI